MMKRFASILLLFTLLWSLCACGGQTPVDDGTSPENGQNRPTQADAVQFMHYRWGDRVSMDMKVPVGWCCESDDHNQYEATAWEDDLPDRVGFDFWLDEAPAFRFSFQCWTQGFGMCGTGVNFEEYRGNQKLTLATERSNDGTIQVTVLFPEASGDYVVTGTVSEDLWWQYSDRVMGILDNATVGSDACMSYEQALKIAQAAVPDMADAENGGHYDVLTGEWMMTLYRDGGKQSVDVQINADGQVISGK